MTIENTELSNDSAAEPALPAETATDASPSSSMDDTIRQAYRAQATKATATELTDKSFQEPDASRQRGVDGKFQRKDANGAQGAAPALEADASIGEEGAAAKPEGQELTESKPHDAAPNTWRKEVATEFAQLPENVREEIHRRENDFHRGIGQYKQAAGFGTEMAQELLPYQQTMQQYGKHPREVVKEATAVWNTLVKGSPQEKANLWLQVAKDYGINLPSLDQAAQQPEDQAIQEDPRLALALQRVERLEGYLTHQERQRAEAEYSQHVNMVQQFGSDPKHKHFQSVREDMAVEIESGRAKDLQDAYDKAIWVNPGVRKVLLAEQETERASKLAADAAKARTAAGANVTRRGTPPVPPKAGSIEDTIRSEYRRLNGGA